MYAPRIIVALETASAAEGTTSRCSARRLLRVITAIRLSARPQIGLRLSWQGRKLIDQRTLSEFFRTLQGVREVPNGTLEVLLRSSYLRVSGIT